MSGWEFWFAGITVKLRELLFRELQHNSGNYASAVEFDCSTIEVHFLLRVLLVVAINLASFSKDPQGLLQGF